MRKTLPRRKTNRDASPKVIYLIGFLAYAAWGAWAYLLFKSSPEGTSSRILFLAALTAATFLTFLFLFYQISKAISGRSPEVVFYPAARRALFLSVFGLVLGGMQILGIFTWINAGLIGLILLLVEIQISRSNHTSQKRAAVDRKGYY